ncbi:hypothetical protein PAPYR_2160 [Paratrimastix pyriformis]|uniref:WH2 domain-containing protein n=1 Tax=Paratrimastix pyriformis TaxID=342808 RepID=A0ABQ8UQZ8_9EUKA|nr:hypothetical protein PAPYR_2160 [Paratrimastix pyriformis]
MLAAKRIPSAFACSGTDILSQFKKPGKVGNNSGILSANNAAGFTGVLLQMTEFARYASSLFTAVSKEAEDVFQQTVKMTDRVNRLQDQMPIVEARLQRRRSDEFMEDDDGTVTRKPLEADDNIGFLTPATRPAAIQELLRSCRQPPDFTKFETCLSQVTQSAHALGSCRRLYTDPTFFATQWQERLEQQMGLRLARAQPPPVPPPPQPTAVMPPPLPTRGAPAGAGGDMGSLLAQIRAGTKLRKVQTVEKSEIRGGFKLKPVGQRKLADAAPASKASPAKPSAAAASSGPAKGISMNELLTRMRRVRAAVKEEDEEDW